jgi:hypothetical protein
MKVFIHRFLTIWHCEGQIYRDLLFQGTGFSVSFPGAEVAELEESFWGLREKRGGTIEIKNHSFAL